MRYVTVLMLSLLTISAYAKESDNDTNAENQQHKNCAFKCDAKYEESVRNCYYVSDWPSDREQCKNNRQNDYDFCMRRCSDKYE